VRVQSSMYSGDLKFRSRLGK